MTIHHFEKNINGHEYRIEVLPVKLNRWRAYLLTMTGGPTALMPFYGNTPDEAAEQLLQWLARAHHVASDSA